jgi:hypothetical protein
MRELTNNSLRQNLWLRNEHRTPIVLCIEPWASELLIPPGVDYQVIAEGPSGYTFLVVPSDGRITIHGWPGSVVSVFDGENEVMACRQVHPPIPIAPREPGGG